jgi:3-methyladenine DNA glycosylase/8-oxoguanine DNA glycosylase
MRLGDRFGKCSDRSVPTQTTTIPVVSPFEFALCLQGHGWIALAPHRFDQAAGRWQTVLRLGRKIVDAVIEPKDRTASQSNALQVTLLAKSRLASSEVASAKMQLRHMMRLDDDLSAFYAICASDPQRAWIAARGAGRLLRSATVFEDLMKLLFTTNTTWTSTEHMTRNLVAAIGSKSPSGQRAFPTPKQCLRDEGFYRDIVRCGYRAGAALALASAFASGELRDETFLAPQPSDQLWRRLCDLRGFGPYAAGQAMRLCGHYDRLAIDSWCRATIAKLDGKKQPPADNFIERRYAKLAPFQGLAMWCDLTASWH